MIYIWLNILPIAVATLIGLVIGGIWLRLSRLTASVSILLIAAIAIFWLAAILAGAVILAPPQADPWTMALGSAFIIWVGFVAPALSVTLRAVGTAWRLVSSACAFWLALMLTQAVIFRLWGLVPPPV